MQLLKRKNTAIQSIDDTLAQARNNINGANTNALVDENLEDGKQKVTTYCVVNSN